MKKVILCGILVAPLVASASNRQVCADETKPPISPSAFDGKLRLQVGTKYEMRFFARSQMLKQLDNPDSSAFKVVNSSIIKFTADYHVISVDRFGNYQIRVTYGDFTMDLDAAINSKRQSALSREAHETLRKYLAAVKGSTFTMKASPENKVFAVYGLPVLRARLLNQLNPPPRIRKSTERFFAGVISEKVVTSNFGNQGGQLPPYPMRVSESWDYSTPASSGDSPNIPIVVGRRTLVSLTNGIAVIKDTGKFLVDKTSNSKNSAIKPPVSTTMASTQNVVSRIDNSTGMLIEAVGTQSLTRTSVSSSQKPSSPFTAVTQYRVVVEEK